MSSRSSTMKLMRYGMIGLSIAIVLLYALYRSYAYIQGPRIDIYSPLSGSAIASSTVTIIGQAHRINDLQLNGKTIFIDQMGNFKETLLVFPGTNTLTIRGYDRFGRTITKSLLVSGPFTP